MQRYSLTHLPDATLLEHGLRSARTESASTATLLAHIAGIDRRRLFAEGQMSLTAVNLLAERAAKAQATARKQVVASEPSNGLLAPALVAPNGASGEVPREVPMAAPSPAVVPAAVVAPALPRYPLHALLGKVEQEDLEYQKALLGHAVPSGEITQVLGRVFQAAIRALEREKFAVTSRSRSGSARKGANPRHVPDTVRRAVFERDRGCCTFPSAKGHRCASRNRLEFDHVLPVAGGGKSTVDNVRLRCRTHNQHAAERAQGHALGPQPRMSPPPRNRPASERTDAQDKSRGRGARDGLAAKRLRSQDGEGGA